MRKIKKILALFVCALMMATVLPGAAFAAGGFIDVSTEADLVNAVAEGAKIRLTADITMSDNGRLGINEGLNVEIDLNNHTIKSTDNRPAISNYGGYLTVSNGSLIGDGEGNGLYCGNGGTLIVSKCEINGGWNGIYNNGGNVAINDCTVDAVHYAIYNEGGNVTVNSGVFKGNSGDEYYGSVVNDCQYDDNGAIPNSAGTIVINSGTFENSVENLDGTIEINGGFFKTKPGIVIDTLSSFVKNGNGYYELKKELPPVVSVSDANGNTVYYADAERAFSETMPYNGKSGSYTVALLANVSVSGTKYVKTGEVTIDLAGHNLNWGINSWSPYSAILVDNKGKLNVTDTGESEGKITVKSTATGNGTYFAKINNGSVITGNVNYECNFAAPRYSAVFSTESAATASVEIKNGVFKVNETSDGTAAKIIKTGTSVNDKVSTVVYGGTFTTTNGNSVNVGDFLPEDMAQNEKGEVQNKSGKTYNLTVNFPEPLKVTVNGKECTSGNALTFDEYYTVKIQLSGSNPFYNFTGWSDGTTNKTVSIFMTQDVELTANMEIYKTEEITENNRVYEVTTPAQLNYLAKIAYLNNESFAGKTIKLMNDLDFEGKGYFPIGRKGGASFAGTFDGNGKKISNMKVTAHDYAGVIGKTAGGAVIKDLTVEGSSFVPQGVYDEQYNTYAGAIVASATGAQIINCSSINNTCYAWFSGAIAGHGYPINEISDCTVENANVDGAKNGGIVGFVGCSGNISGVTVANSTINGGAIIGDVNDSGTISITNAVVQNTKNEDGALRPIVLQPSSAVVPQIKIGGEKTDVTVSSIVGSVPNEKVEITAGTYQNSNGDKLDVTEYIPEDLTQDENGTVVVAPAASVTKADGTVIYYDSFEDAYWDLSAECKITLLKDFEDTFWTINIKENCSLELNGKTLKVRGINVLSDVNLTVSNGKIEGTGDYAISVEHNNAGNEGTVEINNCTVTSAGINTINNNGGNITLNNSEIKNTNTVSGSGVYCAGGNVTVNDSTITSANGNSISGVKGGNSGLNPNIVINGGTITGNDAGISNGTGSTVTINGNPTVEGKNFGINNSGTATIDGNPTVTGKYGGINNNGGTATLNGGTFTGGVNNTNNGTLTITGGTYKDANDNVVDVTKYIPEGSGLTQDENGTVVVALDAPEIIPTLGWDESSQKFTMDFLFGDGFTRTDGYIYQIILTSQNGTETPATVGKGYDGAGFKMNNTNEIYTAKSKVTDPTTGITGEGTPTEKAAIYSLVINNILARANGTDTFAKDQCNEANNVLANGGIYLVKNADGSYGLPEATSKIMTYADGTITLKENAFKAGIKFTEIKTATKEDGSEVTVTVSKDGKSITLSDVIASESEVIMLDAVVLEFVPETIEEDVVDDSDVSYDYSEEIM